MGKSSLGCSSSIVEALVASGLMLAGCASGPHPTVQAQTAAKISAIVPNSTTVGVSGLTLQVTGMNFTRASVVLWSGMPRKTSFMSSTSLSAAISAEDLNKPATLAVSVENGDQGMNSNAVSFTVEPLATAPLEVVTTALPPAKAGVSYAATLSAVGGTPNYHWSVSAGALPSGLALDADSGTLSGVLVNSGSFDFTVEVQDSSAARSKAQRSLALQVAASVPSPTPASEPGFYGSGIASDGLGNTTLGPNSNKISYRIRPKLSGPLAAVRTYLIMDHPGYFAGTGGSVLVTLQTDDGSAQHRPSGTKLASAVLPHPLAIAAPARYFPTFSFSPAPSVTAGELLHVVFENTDQNPAANYISVDSLYQSAAPQPSQPTISDTDCAVLLYSDYWPDGLIWKPRQGYTPIVELDYENGTSEGTGYMEAWVGAPESISGSASVRETLAVGGSSREITSVGIRVARSSGNDPLTLRLENADGTLVEQGSVAASVLPITQPISYVWVKYAFVAPHTLIAGQTYHLVLESASSSNYQTYPIRKGSYYGFKANTFFPDGFAQFKQGGTWVGWTQWGVTNRTDADLQFYFTTE